MNLSIALKHLFSSHSSNDGSNNTSSNNKPHRVHNALLWLRSTYVKHQDGVARLRQRGGLSALLRVVSGGAATGNSKHVDMALSILANCAMESASRRSILKQNGVKTLGDLLPTVEQSSIQNRICRLLGNLSQDPKCCQVIHDNGVMDALTRDVDEKGNEKSKDEDSEEKLSIIEQIIKLLEESTDPDCQQTYLRTIRLLCDTPAHQDRVIADGALKVACLCLKSTDKNVLTATLKTLAHLTMSVEKETTLWQLMNGEGPNSLVTVATTNLDPAIAKSACSLLLHFAKIELLRPTLAGAEALTIFLEKAADDSLEPRQRIPYLNALCICCKDVVNRVRIRDGGGLELLLRTLEDSKYRMLFNRIISSLVCFLYDDAGMEILRSNGLVTTMMKQLRRVARLDVVEESSKTEEEKKVVFMIGDEEEEDMNEDKAQEQSELLDKSREESIGPLASIQEENTSHESEANGSKEKALDEAMEVTEESNQSTKVTKTLDKTSDKDTHVTASLENEEKKQDEPKYSIDSPTYKAISEFKFEHDTDDGPRNIMEAQQLSTDPSYSPCSSPLSISHSPRSGSYSPLSVSSYMSSDWSPGASPRSLSPPIFLDDDLARAASPPTYIFPPASSASSSPVIAPASARALFPNSPMKITPVRTPSTSPSASSTSANVPSATATGPSPPVGAPSPKSPARVTPAPVARSLSDSPGVSLRSAASFGALWWCPEESQHAAEFSDDEDFTKEDPKKIELSSDDVLVSDPLYLESMASTDFGRVLQGNSITGTPKQLSPAASTDSIRDLQKRTSRGKGPGKRKHSQTPDERSRIERRLSSSSLASASGVDIYDLIEKLKEAKSPKTGGKLDGIDIDKYNDPKKATEHNILTIMAKLSYIDDPSDDIVRKDVIETLLDYAIKADEPLPRGSRILLRISTNPSCFHKSLHVRFPCILTEKLGEIVAKVKSADGEEPVIKKQKQHNSSEDRQQKLSSLYQQLLRNLAMTAESRYGLSLLERIVQSSNFKARTHCVLCVPYFSCSEAIRSRIFGNTDVIHYLCQFLLDPTERATAMSSILYLLKQLPKPQMTETLVGYKTTARKSHVSQESPKRDMFFVLDCGSKLSASREALVENSEVFGAMLGGHFLEADQSEVSLAKVDAGSMQVLIDCLEGSTKLFEETTNATPDNIWTMLNLLELSHRYLINDLYIKALSVIDHNLLSRSSLECIMTFSQKHQLQELASACVRYVLWNDDLNDADKVKALKSMREERQEAFVDIMEDVLTKAHEKIVSS